MARRRRPWLPAAAAQGRSCRSAGPAPAARCRSGPPWFPTWAGAAALDRWPAAAGNAACPGCLLPQRWPCSCCLLPIRPTPAQPEQARRHGPPPLPLPQRWPCQRSRHAHHHAPRPAPRRAAASRRRAARPRMQHLRCCSYRDAYTITLHARSRWQHLRCCPYRDAHHTHAVGGRNAIFSGPNTVPKRYCVCGGFLLRRR